MSRARAFGLVAGAAAAAFGLFPGPAGAERHPLDGVVAVVNDDVILASELGEEVAVRLYQLGPGAPEARDVKSFTGEVLASMIDTRLLIQDADKRNIVVSNDDIKPYVDEDLARLRQAFATPEEYEAALAQYGMTEKTYAAQLRKNIRDQLKITRLTDEVLGPRVTLEESEIRAYYDSRRADLARPTSVTVREIAVAKKPTAASTAAAKARLEEVRRAALAGGDFAALGRAVAADAGGEFNASFVFGPGEAVPALERAVGDLKVGEFSPVFVDADGFWLVRLTALKDGRRDVQFVRLPFRVTPDDAAAARTRVEAAAAALARGEPFEKVAKEYSDNAESANAGGLVGELSLAQLQRDMPEIAVAMGAMKVGDVSPVIERSEGFFIVRLDARAEGRDVTYDEARDSIKHTLRSQKLALEQQKYLVELKDKAYIKTYD